MSDPSNEHPWALQSRTPTNSSRTLKNNTFEGPKSIETLRGVLFVALVYRETKGKDSQILFWVMVMSSVCDLKCCIETEDVRADLIGARNSGYFR